MIVNGLTIEPGANLAGADLNGANLAGADLNGANLAGADLNGANLAGANLIRANLNGAYLIRANLAGANLRGTGLTRANLRGTGLTEANLTEANLTGANLTGADLRGADLRRCIGNNREIKTLQLGTYQVTMSRHSIAIGCQQHSIKDWFAFNDDQITDMDRGQSLTWWNNWKDTIELVWSRSYGKAGSQ